MTNPRRGRGRPRGTGLRDERTLRSVAASCVADPKLRPTTAIKRIVGNDNPSELRRLQMKWKRDKAVFLREAQQLHDLEPYDPIRHADAPIGSLARVNQNNAALWDSMSRAGWHNVEGLPGGEWKIRRDLHGVITEEELLAQCAAYF